MTAPLDIYRKGVIVLISRQYSGTNIVAERKFLYDILKNVRSKI